jgi:secreted PhoX family phosphatase
MDVDRRSFLKGTGAVAAGAALGGPFQGFLARTVTAAGPPVPAPALAPVADQRDGVARLALPPGFAYRSFDRTGIPMAFGGNLPGNHDGMAAFGAGPERVLLIRNHEVNGSTGAYTDAPDVPVYDGAARGGNTYVLVDLHGNVERTWPALAGTQMNCAGGSTPWRSWITCEETVNGPDVFDDFTRNIPTPSPDETYIQNARLDETHGYIFEVPADGVASAEPITHAGRFAHEAAVFDPITGSIYLTEDNFGFGSGLYRYDPPVDPRRSKRIEDGGTLWMLGVEGGSANLSGEQERGTRYPVRWVRIDDPNPQFPMVGGVPTTINNRAIVNVGEQGWDAGGAVFSRLEGIVADKGVVYFTATQGGGDPEPVDWMASAEGRGGFGRGTGQVWALHPQRGILEVVYQSTSTADLRLPDNVTASPRGTLILCEDNSGPNRLQALDRWGRVTTFAQRHDLPNVEFAGACFSPNGKTLYCNLNTGSALTVAIWGPWHTLGI